MRRNVAAERRVTAALGAAGTLPRMTSSTNDVEMLVSRLFPCEREVLRRGRRIEARAPGSPYDNRRVLAARMWLTTSDVDEIR
jgi:hypothetical protein